MSVPCTGPKGIFSAPFGLSILVFTLAPTHIGYQDVASLLVRQPAVAAHWRQHLRASTFGTIHAATFSFSMPVGTAMPPPLSAQLASLDPRALMQVPPPDDSPLEFPTVDRSAKGDRLPGRSEPEIAKAVQEPAPPPSVAAKPNGMAADAADFAPAARAEPVREMARIYLGEPPEETAVTLPLAPADPDIKLSALDPRPADDQQSGESVAGKGQVTGAGKRPITPAERLDLDGKARAKAEKCLADAIYFEARGEPVRGQMAVAQVVMNRVFSGYYPRNVCETVYQNARRRFACQFTFACDGIPEVVTEPQAWVRATQIAKDMLDGNLWVPEVDRATHYHAYWVRPSWVGEMKKLYKFGVHTFYRPRAWGDGSDAPSWGNAAATKEASAKL